MAQKRDPKSGGSKSGAHAGGGSGAHAGGASGGRSGDRSGDKSGAGHHRALHENIWFNLCVGAAFTIAMWWLASWVESRHFYFGVMTKELVYDIIQHQMGETEAKQPPSVVVVDISDAPETTVGVQPNKYDYTNRDFLKKLAMTIAAQRPAGIGIDVDFTPYPAQLDDDDQFLACLLTRSTGSRVNPKLLPKGDVDASCIADGQPRVPIFVATYTSLMLGPTYAMERPEYSTLAAFAGAVNPREYEAPRKMVYSVEILTARPQGQTWLVKSLSAATYGKTPTAPPRELEWAAEMLPITANQNFLATEFYVDYGTIDPIESATIPEDKVLDPAQTQNANWFAGKYVLIGRGSQTTDMDQHTIPGRPDRKYSGVYLHASGVHTLNSGKLLGLLLPRGRLILDLTLFLLIFGVVESTRWARARFFEAETRTGVLHLAVTVVVVIAAVIAGIYAVSRFRLMWDDSLFVGMGLIAHSIVDHIVTGA